MSSGQKAIDLWRTTETSTLELLRDILPGEALLLGVSKFSQFYVYQTSLGLAGGTNDLENYIS